MQRDSTAIMTGRKNIHPEDISVVRDFPSRCGPVMRRRRKVKQNSCLRGGVRK